MASSLFQNARPATPATQNRPAIGGAPKMVGGINPAMIQQIKQTMNTLRTLKNPQAAIMQAAQQNPQLNAVIQMCQGRNPQDVFMEQCKHCGIDPNQAVKQIQGMLS